MKLKLLSLFLILSSSLCAAPKKIMRCIGLEEEFIHKQKISGPYDYLNKSMISHLLQFPSIVNVHPDIVVDSCERGKKFPSMILLKNILKKKTKAFVISKSKESETMIAKSMVEDFSRDAPRLFIDFISKVQSLAPNAKCLTTEIPQLKDLYLKMKHVQDKMTADQILDSVGDINSIFNKLNRIDYIFKRCKKYQTKKTDKNG